ncbi:MAG: hypothetical protein ACYDA6_10545 [Solirubrobacteraceae bacterium]
MASHRDERFKIEGDPEDALRALLGAESPASFFAERGFELTYSEADVVVWADLRSVENPAFTHSKYGRGPDEASAPARAAERWRSEQGD